MTEPHVASVALTGVSEAEHVHPVPLHRHCSDEPQGACGGEACFLEQLAGGCLLRSFARVD